MTHQLFSETADLANNREPRCACVLLLDTSGSMEGDPIRALNDGIKTLESTLKDDDVAAKRVELCVVAYNTDVRVLHAFSTVDHFSAPSLAAGGLTWTGTAANVALDLIDKRKAEYKQANIRYYRPWVFLLTDGEPQGEGAGVYERAAQRIHQLESENRVAFFAVGVGQANMGQLGQLTPRQPLHLNGLDFRSLFLWLSSSLSGVGNSEPEQEQLALPAPTGWATV